MPLVTPKTQRFPSSKARLGSGLFVASLLLTGCGGVAESTPGASEGRDCQDGDITYQDGEQIDCACSCSDGEISCDLILCEEPPDSGCEQYGIRYENGEHVPTGTDCGACTCWNGEISCNLILCEDTTTCAYGGVIYEEGQGFPSTDGCNSCVCEGVYGVSCTEQDCSPSVCELDFDAGWCSAAFEVYWYNPTEGACEPRFYGGCEGNENRFETLEACEQACGGGVSPEEVSCVVAGVEYAHGATGVPDPFSCNTCTCENGVVTYCTEINCPTECPPNAVPGSQCAECGPTDACLAVETGCLLVCNTSEDCLDVGGLCLEGLCKNVCG